MGPALFVLWSALASSPLDDAREQVRAVKYVQAAKSLKAAAKLEGLTRAEALEYFELRGVVSASLLDGDAAKAAFISLLSLDPEVKLKGRPSPKVTTPFFAARAQVREQGGVSLKFTSAEQKDGVVEALVFSLRVVSGLTEQVAVDVVEDGVGRAVVVPAAATVRVPVKGRQVSALAVVRTAQRWALSNPVEGRFTQSDAPVAEKPLPPPPVTQPVVALAPAPPSFYRPLSYGLMGVAVAGFVLGAVFGVSSQSARNEYLAATSSAGIVTVITRERAQQLGQTASTFAVVANAGLIGGGVTAAAAIVFWLLGLSPAPSAAVASTGALTSPQVGFAP
jgi:hypothetical protein